MKLHAFRTLAMLTVMAALVVCPACSRSDGPMVDPPQTFADASVLVHTVNRIDGTPESLETYAGQVVLIVNVASRCGLTPQYEDLEALYREFKDQGFVVLGFPANEFMNQEPGTNEEIAAYCSREFDVTFPMFEKIVCKGEDAHALFAELALLSEPPSWNFTKYLIDREGRLVERIDPRTKPSDPRVVESIRTLLEG